MTISEIHELLVQSLRVLVPEADTSPSSPLTQYLMAVAGTNAALFQRLELLRKDSVPSTATFEGALQWGEALGVPRKGPTTARGTKALQLQGTSGAAIPDGAELRAEVGQVTVRIDGQHVIEPGGQALASVVTVDRGEGANLPAGTVLRFATPPAGVQETAKLEKSLAGGVDQEPPGTYQARVARRLAEPPQGGNVGDYRRWVEEALPDVLVTGYPLPNRSGLGSIDLVGLRDAEGAGRVLTAAERQAIDDYIAPRKLATDQVRVIETTTRIVDIEVSITPIAEPRFAFDFADGGGMEIVSWDPVARRITFVSTLPAGLAPNKRISLQVAGGGAVGSSGCEQVVAAIASANAIILVDDPDNPVPTSLGAGDRAFAGGPLVERARHAILDGYAIGCGGDTSFVPGIHRLGPANPNTRYGNWLDRIEPSRIEAAARAQAGVDFAECLAPTATVGSIDPASGGPPPPSATLTTELLIAGEVIVRHA